MEHDQWFQLTWKEYFEKGQGLPWSTPPTDLNPLQLQAYKAGQMLARNPTQMPFDPTVRWVTGRQLDDDIKLLAGKLPWPCQIAGVPRSGMIVAARLATHMGAELAVVHADAFEATLSIGSIGGGRRWADINERKQHLVIVDDSVHTGESIPKWREAFPTAHIAAVYVHPANAHLVDAYAHIWPMHHLFEWHFFGSNLVEQAAFDMDGMICQDCTDEQDDDGPKYLDFITNAEPRWVPRPHTIPLIVTARLQKYEPQTREWLDRHGVKVDRIVFHPASDKPERDKDRNYHQHKALPFRASNCRYFFESCPKQARLIAMLSEKPVICPPTGQVFQ